MHLDVLDLRNFYYRTQLGRVAQRAVRDQLVMMWPVAAGQTVAGFGFAVPLLRPYLADARRVIGLMPGPQGVMPWPAGMENVSVLCEETAWPVSTGLVDRLVLMHGLETSDTPSEVLAECHRVLGPGGRAIFVVPNRSGLWARADGTPFGFGRPYSLRQLEGQLRRHGFTPERHVAALYAPPCSRRFWLRTAAFWEGAGRRFAPWIAGGVLMVEASKQIYAPTRGGLGAVVRRPLRVLEGVRQGTPEPALRQR
ncbi:MAG: class I SAM-dependent methyltransferase [Gemmobacter sp.]|jgi:SAM-dependent methyltransferase|nr:class I SAM-dependent methyltransferase [Gemmobacter sp.]